MWRYLGLGGHFAWLYLVIVHTHVYPFFTIVYERGFVALSFSISLAVALLLFLAWEALAPFMQKGRFVTVVIGATTVVGTALYVLCYMVLYSPPLMFVAVVLAAAGNGLLTLFWGQLFSDISPGELGRYVCAGLLFFSAMSLTLLLLDSWLMFIVVAFLPVLSAVIRLFAVDYTPQVRYPHAMPRPSFLATHSAGWAVLGACLGFFAVLPESQNELAAHIVAVSAVGLVVFAASGALFVFAFRAHPEKTAIFLYRIAIFAAITGVFSFALGGSALRFAGVALVVSARFLFLGLSWLIHPRMLITFGKVRVDAVGWITAMFYCGIALGVVLFVGMSPVVSFSMGTGAVPFLALASMLLALFLFVLSETDVKEIVAARSRRFEKSERQVTESVARQAAAFGLSERETEVVLLLLQGCTISFAAEKLYIAPSTVKTHVKHIYEKLDVRNRQQLRDTFGE